VPFPKSLRIRSFLNSWALWSGCEVNQRKGKKKYNVAVMNVCFIEGKNLVTWRTAVTLTVDCCWTVQSLENAAVSYSEIVHWSEIQGFSNQKVKVLSCNG
jgi:hypothetical protein